jgi:hypothetical protein
LDNSSPTYKKLKEEYQFETRGAKARAQARSKEQQHHRCNKKVLERTRSITSFDKKSNNIKQEEQQCRAKRVTTLSKMSC